MFFFFFVMFDCASWVQAPSILAVLEGVHQIACALRHLHNSGMVHGDVRAANVQVETLVPFRLRVNNFVGVQLLAPTLCTVPAGAAAVGDMAPATTATVGTKLPALPTSARDAACNDLARGVQNSPSCLCACGWVM